MQQEAFPLDDTLHAACRRAEAVVRLYRTHGDKTPWCDSIERIIADLAVLHASNDTDRGMIDAAETVTADGRAWAVATIMAWEESMDTAQEKEAS